MKDKIVAIVQEQKVIAFPELYKALTENSLEFSKPALREAVDILEQEGTILSAFGNIYHPAELQDTEGFAQWTMTGFCWLSNTEDSNEFGITVNAPEEALQIYNKRNVNLACSVQGKIVEHNAKKFFVAQKCDVPRKNVKIIYYRDDKGRTFQVNNENYCTLPISKTPEEAGTIGIAEYDREANEINHIETLGNLSTPGIESKIAYILGDLVPAPQFEAVKDVEGEVTDLTSKLFMTIDSIHTKDRDDAISVERHSDGSVSILVAIADVSSFVPMNSEADLAAREACTTFYLPHQTIHMLSRNLAEDYCSLNPGVEKNAMICTINFDSQLKLVNSSFSQGTIISKACLTYDDVDRMFADQPMIESVIFNEKKILPQVIADLKLIADIEKANPMEINRLERDYNRTELVLGEDGKVTSIVEEQEESTQSQKIVEFSMLNANMAAAKTIYENFGYGIFRNQDEPADIEKPKSAQYQSRANGHWGLNVDFYTHFTSPIRRYCDLSIHRMLKAVMQGKPAPYTEEELNGITARINYQQTKAKQTYMKVNGMLERQYVERLVTSNQMAKNLELIEVTDKGLVCRNKQNIEFFIPEFKIKARSLQDMFTQVQTEENEGKKVAMIRDRFKILGFIDEYSWLDGRLNTTYHITDKTVEHKPKFR